MMPRHAHPEPDKRKHGIGQPVHPAQATDSCFVVKIPVHPHIQEFVRAQARDEIHPKTIGLQVFFSNIEVAFEGRYAPADGSVGENRST